MDKKAIAALAVANSFIFLMPALSILCIGFDNMLICKVLMHLVQINVNKDLNQNECKKLY